MLLNRARDASRFIRYHKTAIESSPLQVYCSPLIFSPLKSLTRISFQNRRPDWVLNYPMVEENWSPCLQTLEGHSHSVNSIAWSTDGSRLASASYDKTVRIWDPATGQSVLNFPIGVIGSIQFDNDNINLLHTNDGTYYIGSKGPMTPVSDDFISPLKQYGYGLSQECSWITYNGLKLLWLPSEYRPNSRHNFARYANRLTIGCSSGRVIFLMLSEHNPVSSL